MSLKIVIAFLCALASTTLINLAYLREHAAALELAPLSLRRPIASLRLLLGNRRWLTGFSMEAAGFSLYVVALALAPLALVQSVGAGGIGLLAVASARFDAQRLTPRARVGAAIAVVGLVLLGLSLGRGTPRSHPGATIAVVAWLAATGGLAALVRLTPERLLRSGVSYGIAGGLLFSAGDIATKLTTQGGSRLSFAVVMIGAYMLGTALLQVGYQRGAALTVAGVATLLANALPIVAGSVLLGETIPSGALGVLRVLAFVTVVAGAILLARPDPAPGSSDDA